MPVQTEDPETDEAPGASEPAGGGASPSPQGGRLRGGIQRLRNRRGAESGGGKPPKKEGAAKTANKLADKGEEMAAKFAGPEATAAVKAINKIEKTLIRDENARLAFRVARAVWPAAPFIIVAIVIIIIFIIVFGSGAAADPNGPKLTITKSGPTEAAVGQSLTYQFAVAYPGTAQEITITDHIPDGTEFDPADQPPAHFDPVTRIVTWKASEMVPVTNGVLSTTNLNFALNLKATVDNAHVVNQAEATVIPAAAPGGLACGQKSTPPANVQVISCSGERATEKTTDGYYMPTNFGCNTGFPKDPNDNCIPGCGVSTIPECKGMSDSEGQACENAVQWYSANQDQYGCNAKLMVTNPETGQAVVVRAIDSGPACWTQSGGAKFDLSQAAYANINAGNKVKVEPVEESVPLGPVNVCSAGGSYIPPSQDTCGGKYSFNNPVGNFGDPSCNFDKNALHEMLKQQDPTNADTWFFKIIPCESSYNPTTYASHESIGTPDPAGAWGLYQMGSSQPPGSPPPAPGRNGPNDRGDVNWPIQTENATTYGKKLSSLGSYWACAR